MRATWFDIFLYLTACVCAGGLLSVLAFAVIQSVWK
jgi:hypothetical protein